MHSTDKIAILMATYNGEKYICQQIDSILSQTCKDWELYIHDDGSTDNTIAAVESYVEKYPDKIHLIDGKSTGGAKYNFFYMFGQVEAPYYMTCDQDDVWKKNKMSEIERVFEDPKVMAVVHDAQIVDEKLSSLDQTTFEWRNSGTGFWKNMKKNSYIGCCMAVRRSAVFFALILRLTNLR